MSCAGCLSCGVVGYLSFLVKTAADGAWKACIVLHEGIYDVVKTMRRETSGNMSKLTGGRIAFQYAHWMEEDAIAREGERERPRVINSWREGRW